MSDTESIYSIVSIEVADKAESDSSDSEKDELINEIGTDLQPPLELEELQFSNMMNIIQDCNHEFERQKGIDSNQCSICRWYPSKDK